MDLRKDKFLAKVALDQGLLTKSQVKEALRLQREILDKDGEAPELGDLVVRQGWLDAKSARDLQMKVKERYFAKLYEKVKAQEAEEKRQEAIASFDSAAATAVRVELIEDSSSDESPPAGRQTSRTKTSQTRRRKAVRPGGQSGSPARLAAAGAAGVIAVLILLALAASGGDEKSASVDDRPRPKPAPSQEPQPKATEPTPAPKNDKAPLGGLFSHREYEKEVDNPSGIDRVQPPPDLGDVARVLFEKIMTALTEGRWTEAQAGCREFAAKFPNHEIAAEFLELARQLADPEFRSKLAEELRGE